jgi:hypothetical protein
MRRDLEHATVMKQTGGSFRLWRPDMSGNANQGASVIQVISIRGWTQTIEERAQ